MKLINLILLLSIAHLSAKDLYSQNAIVNLNVTNKTIVEILDELEKLSPYLFFYNEKDIDVNKKIAAGSFINSSVSEVLTSIFSGTNVNYSLFKDYIVLSKNLIVSDNIATTQQQTATGKVIDENGNPMPGVNVQVKGTTIGTTTDINGKYILTSVDGNAVIVFSFIGYMTKEIPLNGTSTLNVSLENEIIDLQEVVVIGYGTQKKSDLTGSIQKVNVETYQNQPLTSLVEMLNGTVAGLITVQGTTAQGGGTMDIRGQTSLKANNSPLIVVDGAIFNGDIVDINPADIESLDILKDASSAAIFGARSSSGIIIITTKRGTTGPPSINFSAKLGIVSLTNRMRPLNPEEYLLCRGDYLEQLYPDKPSYYYRDPYNLPSEISLETWKNYDVTPSSDPIDMWFNRLNTTNTEKTNYKAGKTVNWFDVVLQNGMRQDYDISLSGGITNLKYFWSIGYTGNKGYILGDEFRTVRSRINVDANVKKLLNFKLSLQYADRDEGFEPARLWEYGSPYGQIYADDGTLNFYTHEDATSRNPLIWYTFRDLLNKTQILFATFSAEVKLPLGISYSAVFSPHYEWNRNYSFDNLNTPEGLASNGVGSRDNNTLYEWQVDNLLKWNKTIAGIHDVDITLLFNAEKYQSWSDVLSNTQFAPTDALSYHGIGAGTTPGLSSNDEYSTGNALMGRLNYSLLSKYLFTATLRRDGYSAFGQDNPFAYFPSFAFAWKISEEGFFKVNWIDNAKIRMSWGVNGNRDIGRYDALAKLTTLKYLYGTTLAVGVYTSTMANSTLKWERTEAYNIGLDFGLLNNRISTTVDAYRMTTYDLLMDRSLPSLIGYSSVASNLGELRNTGIEITLNANIIRSNKVQWNSSIVFSHNHNKIIHLYGDIVDIYDTNGNVIGQKEADDWTNNWFIGESIDRIWEYKILGVYQLGEEGEAAVYAKKPGEFKLEDVNNDGKLVPADDKVFQGYKKPQYLFGLRNDVYFLHNFKLSTFIRGDLGYSQVNNINAVATTIQRKNIYYAPYWTPSNPSNEYAKVSIATEGAFLVYRESSFIRLQDVSLSYNLPKAVLQKFKINSLQLSINLRNYLTITKWDHWDPESGTTPMPKYITFGIDTNF